MYRLAKKMMTALIAICLALTACAAARAAGLGDGILLPKEGQTETDTLLSDQEIEAVLQNMTLEEKAAQLFFITPEALTGADAVQAAGDLTRQSFAARPVGGIIYFEQNIVSRAQVEGMLSDMQRIAVERLGVPVFLATDEEGGRVRRVSGVIEDTPEIGPMLTLGESGDAASVRETGRQIARYLTELGFNLDFAPVADIYSNPENTVIGDRAFGTCAEPVAGMVAEITKGMKDGGVCCTLKHFPGHGDTREDSHNGYAATEKTLEELRRSELLPFRAGIEAGADLVMAAHISLPNVPGDDVPASLSRTMITDLLRTELGFQKVVITDALNMGAVADHYTSGEAAVMALQAGCDMLLMPEDFEQAYQAVLDAVKNGGLSEERINESVRRILRVKQSL